jgi:hypothetical protein
LSGGSYSGSLGRWLWSSLGSSSIVIGLSAIRGLFRAVLEVNFRAEAEIAIDLSSKATVAFLLRYDLRGVMLK